MKPIIRTITGFISVKDFSNFEKLLQRILDVKADLKKAKYEVQTVRITTDILEQGNFELLEKYTNFLKGFEKNNNVNIYHLGSIENPKILNAKSEAKVLGYFQKHKKAYVTINASKPEFARELTSFGARMCKKIAAKNPFDCRRFAVYAGVTKSTPFYPASKVFDNSMKIAIGLQCANLAVEEAQKSSGNKILFEQKLIKRMEQEFSKIAQLIPMEIKKYFIGFDTSLASFPKNEFSIANAIEIILGKPFGSSGTLSICRLLTSIMQNNNIVKTGLCGLMLPVIEDNILAKRGIEGKYGLNELLLFSAVCATGLDTVPISGKTSVKDLADCYLDLVTLANKLQKPLSARIFIEPNKNPGETIKYDWEFACKSPIFKV